MYPALFLPFMDILSQSKNTSYFKKLSCGSSYAWPCSLIQFFNYLDLDDLEGKAGADVKEPPSLKSEDSAQAQGSEPAQGLAVISTDE
jgi:hypothetical protein